MSVPNVKRIALFIQKLLGGFQNFEIGSRDPGHVHVGIDLYSIRRKASSSCLPNLKRFAQFVQKLLRGSQNLEIRSRDPSHAHLGSFYAIYGPYAERVCPLCLYQISNG